MELADYPIQPSPSQPSWLILVIIIAPLVASTLQVWMTHRSSAKISENMSRLRKGLGRQADAAEAMVVAQEQQNVRNEKENR